MSLTTDIIFARALQSNKELMSQLPAGNVYNTSVELPDEDMDNIDLPYIIVHYDGMNNTSTSKDSEFEAYSDNVEVGITIVARNREKLGELAESVRSTIVDYFNDHCDDDSDDDSRLIPEDITLSATNVNYDQDKPCYWQELNYLCEILKNF